MSNVSSAENESIPGTMSEAGDSSNTTSKGASTIATNSSPNKNTNASTRSRQANSATRDKLISSEPKDFSGAMKNFYNILSMRYENDLVKKVSFMEFKRSYISHVECNSEKYGNELADFLRTEKDPKKVLRCPHRRRRSHN